ncbi:hypothetical protein, partial [Yersinia wautersii]|uniref:hypothetical protein n=1 Tax=Yersinia wautersii TaxID=1341643 RepID=UPI001EE32325
GEGKFRHALFQQCHIFMVGHQYSRYIIAPREPNSPWPVFTSRMRSSATGKFKLVKPAATGYQCG